MDKPGYLNFNIDDYPWKPDMDYREHPELYKVGKGEQGVLICEPYKSEIGQYWRFKNALVAKESSDRILALFHQYFRDGDFVGADMARKYLQMDFTRARRYANYKGGRKYDKENGHQQLARGTGDPEKVLAAQLFYERWQAAERNPTYSKLKKDWKLQYG